MGSSEERIVAVIMVGGPTKGTRFRPLSLNIPKPLFPLAGQPMVNHPISACKRIPNLAQVYLIGFYEEREFALFVSSTSNELKVPIRYLREDKPHGSAGGLYNFRDLIMEDNPSHIFLLNCDVCCSFPLPEMLDAHKRYGGLGTILVIKVSPESANQFGELVADRDTNELLHYTEKPETFVSDRINCGVYIFTPDIFTAIQGVSTQRKDRATLRRVSSFEALQPANRSLPTDFVRLDQDILSPLAGKRQFYVYETLDFWEQIKTPGMSLKCSGLYLAQFRFTSPHLLATGDGTKKATISGDVYIHPSAKVHPTAKIGPNVSISANARIGAGVRLVSCIILDDVEIKELAGLSVASAIAEVYKSSEYTRVLVICGPGNNAGIGLAAARHLHHFGYKLQVCYPNCAPNPLYKGLVTQLESLFVPFLSMQNLPPELLNFDILIDSIFGFLFQGNSGPPYDDLIENLVSLSEQDQAHQKTPVIVSVDVPSGWHVEDGEISGRGMKPHMLVSLIAPKLCAKRFSGSHHFLGGRFIPPSILHDYELQLPPYCGTSMCVRIGKPHGIGTKDLLSSVYCDKIVEHDPFVQFQKWYADAMTTGVKEPDSMALSTSTRHGKPSSRIVQLKKVHQGGFIWCSNYGSRKAHEISENPHGALLFYWSALNRQVRVEGVVQKVSDEESEQFFISRPREIQIVPAVSQQSTVIPGREYIQHQCKTLEEKYSNGNRIPRPKNWGGYRLVPERFEFWQGDESSVHMRYMHFSPNIRRLIDG
ncbi:mannose-1-phosphate guanyltransferase alpha-like [Dorcoceras hygrometricum]|uniref:pyridoxal 5'-phosphate synthase n=2 Tax=Magnoliopsida TaxID=3398 RepID=A0A2Z7D9J2_9LAMI|nr:mannose-1-phosphate guanyltransferase alpha-like [Dorcoceras hygrometricum]